MAESSPTTPPAETTDLLGFLAQRPRHVAYGLFALAFLWGLGASILLVVYRENFALEGVVLHLPALVALGVGIWQLLRQPGQLDERDATRLVILIVGGVIGLDLVIVSFTLGYQWWEFIAGGMKVWATEKWRLWLIVLIQFTGLALMFFCLQLVRTQERSSAVLRRMLYGYNAALTGLLLVEILAVLNVLGAIFLPEKDNWTTKSIYALSSRSENILQGLNKPTNVYVILRGRSELDQFLYSSVHALLENCQAVNDRIQVQYLNPDQDLEKVTRLAEQYQLKDPAGVLVVYGTEPNMQSEFITRDALVEGSNPMGPPSERRAFKGESELMTVMNSLEEGKQKPVIYFTQGDGELDLSDFNPRDPDKGLGMLKRRLEADRITVKGLRFSVSGEGPSKDPNVVIASEVPKDASVVVIAGPQQRFSDQALKALRDYMEPPGQSANQTKGKLFVLMGVVADAQGRMVKTGLEDLLADFNVKLGDNRVMQVGDRRLHPLTVDAMANPAQDYRSRNRVAEVFAGRRFQFHAVRTVEAEPGRQPNSSRYLAETLFFLLPGLNIWAETNLSKDPIVLRSDYLKKERIDELAKKLAQDALPMAVTVTEPAPRTNPHDFGQANEPGTPRLVVFGTVTLASNVFMSDRMPPVYYDLFQSLLSWLRGRPNAIGIEPKKSDVYAPDTANVSKARMALMPAALLGIGIIGLGTGVWVVRRR